MRFLLSTGTHIISKPCIDEYNRVVIEQEDPSRKIFNRIFQENKGAHHD